MTAFKIENMKKPTIQQIFDGMPGRFNADAARGLNTVIQFNITGDNGGTFHAVIKDGNCIIQQGIHPSPSMAMAMTADDYIDMVMGKLPSHQAFLRGRLRVTGNLNIAVRLRNLFKPIET